MSSMTTYLKNKYRDHMGAGTTFTPPAGKFVQLHTGAPGLNGTSNVLAGVTRRSTTLVNGAGDGTLTNSGEIIWTNMPAVTSPAISHFTVWDAITGSNPMFQGALSTPRTTTAGQTFRVPVGDLDITYT